MTQQTRSPVSWSEFPWLAAAALVPGIFFLQHWEPCDSVAGIASGDSLLSIGLCLVGGVLAGAGVAFQSPSTSAESRRRWLGIVLAIACLLAIAWLALATIAVSGRGNLRFAINGFWQWTSMLVWGTSIGLLASRPGFARLAITAMMGWGFGMLVYGYWEYCVIQPELRRQLEQDPVGLFRRQGVSLESAAGLLLADRIRSTEMKGVYALANSFGGFLACYWVLTLGTWSFRRSRTWLAWTCMLLVGIGVGLLLTKSRTAWIAAGVGTVLLGLFSAMENGRLRGRALGIGGLAAIAASSVGLFLVYRFDPLILKEAGKSLAYRFDYWRGASVLIARDPWFGFGVGNFQSTYLHVKLPTAAESPADPHNFLLETAHAGGIPLLLLVVVAIGLAFWIATMPSRNPSHGEMDDRGSHPLAIAFWLGASFGLACLVAWSFFVDSDERLVGAIFALAAAAAAMVAGSRWPAARTSAQLLVQNKTALWIVFAVMLIHCLASGGWLLPGTMSLGMLALGLSLGGPSDGERTTAATSTANGAYWVVARFGWVVAGAIFLVAWYGTMAVPVSKGLEKVGAILEGSVSNPSPRQVQSVAAADVWDPELARIAMDWSLRQLSRPMGQEARREWETALRELQETVLDRDPQNALAWESCGQASVRLAATAGDLEGKNQWLARADQMFERAVQLSPVSAQGHIQAALAASWVGDWERSRRHCQESEKIDSATSHRDRKIERAVVVWPISLVPREASLGGDARRGLLEDQVKAEPVLRYLRSQGNP